MYFIVQIFNQRLGIDICILSLEISKKKKILDRTSRLQYNPLHVDYK